MIIGEKIKITNAKKIAYIETYNKETTEENKFKLDEVVVVVWLYDEDIPSRSVKAGDFLVARRMMGAGQITTGREVIGYISYIDIDAYEIYDPTPEVEADLNAIDPNSKLRKFLE